MQSRTARNVTTTLQTLEMSFDFLDENSSDHDLYEIIGADETSTIDQIKVEFKHRAKILHPDKVTGAASTQKAHDEFERLRWAYEILSNVDTRAKYDFWRRSDLAISFKAWLKLNDSSRTSIHWGVKPKKKLMLPGGNVSSDDQDDRTLLLPTMNSSHAKEYDETERNCKSQSDEDRTNTKQSRTVKKRTINGWGSSKLSRKFRKYEI